MLKSSPRLKFVACLSVASLLLSTAALPAATIDWGLGAQSITGDIDVDGAGDLLKAYVFADTQAVVAGVTFENVLPGGFTNSAPTTTVGSGEGSLTLAGSTLFSGSDVFGGDNAPFASLSDGYRTLLASSVWNDSGSNRNITLTINDLVPGRQYRIQFWVNDSRSFGQSRTTTFTAGNAVLLHQNTGAANGGVGQFVIGTFTADATTQTIVASSGASTNINGYTIAAVPEPGVTGAAMGLALLALLTFRRSKRTARSH